MNSVKRQAHRVILLAIVLTVALPATVEAGSGISICELVKHGEEMNGQPVRLSAIYFTDLLETSGIKDLRCPSVVLALFGSDEEPQDPSIDKFDKAVAGRLSDLRLRRFSIDVSGTFVWRKDKMPHGALIMKKIWAFKRVQGTK